MIFKILLGVMVVALMVGPIMMMQPSRGERRLVKLRKLAMQNNLKVRVVPSPLGGGGASYASYTQSWPDEVYKRIKSQQLPNWRLEQLELDHEIHFHGRWEWSVKPSIALGYADSLKQEIDSLRVKAVMIEVNKLGVGIVWPERVKDGEEQSVIEEISRFLAKIIQSEANQFPERVDQG